MERILTQLVLYWIDSWFLLKEI